MKNFAEFAKKHLFFDKVKLCRSTTSLKTNLSRKCFLVKFDNIVGTAFLQKNTERILLIIAVSIVMKGELANETVSYDTKTKACMPV